MLCLALFSQKFNYFLATPTKFEAIIFIIDYQRKQIMDSNQTKILYFRPFKEAKKINRKNPLAHFLESKNSSQSSIYLDRDDLIHKQYSQYDNKVSFNQKSIDRCQGFLNPKPNRPFQWQNIQKKSHFNELQDLQTKIKGLRRTVSQKKINLEVKFNQLERRMVNLTKQYENQDHHLLKIKNQLFTHFN